MVEPLIRTPMAMTASNGCEGIVAVLVAGAGVAGRLSPNESNELTPPIRSVAVVLACICPADIILWANAGLESIFNGERDIAD